MYISIQQSQYITKLRDWGPQLLQYFVLLYFTNTHPVCHTHRHSHDTSWSRRNTELTNSHLQKHVNIHVNIQDNLPPWELSILLLHLPQWLPLPHSPGALGPREWCGWMCIITTCQTGNEPTWEGHVFNLFSFLHFPRACLLVSVSVYPILWYSNSSLHGFIYLFMFTQWATGTRNDVTLKER